MNNCLVKKLKGTVDNEALSKINSFRFIVDTSSMPDSTDEFTHGLRLSAGGQYSIMEDVRIIEGNVSLYNPDTTSWMQLPVSEAFFTAAKGKGIIECSPKYSVYELSFGRLIMPDFDICETMNYFQNLRNFKVRYSNALIDLGKIHTVIDTLNIFNIEHSHNVLGDIATIGSYFPNVTRIIINNTSIVGSIEGLVSAFISAGKSNGTVSVAAAGTDITYNGELAGNGNLTWDAQGNITWSAS